jgi:hypothetical protein
VSSRDWLNDPIWRFSEVPEISGELIETQEERALGADACAPGQRARAIGNAVAPALGVCMRDLPLPHEHIASTRQRLSSASLVREPAFRPLVCGTSFISHAQQKGDNADPPIKSRA